MGLRRKRPFERLKRGGFRVNLDPDEREVLLGLLGQMRDLLVAAPADTPHLRRLFPTAYPTDPEADAEYQRLMREELVGSRLAAMETVSAVLDPAAAPREVTAGDLTALMTSMNSLRLVLGTICNVGEDDDLAGVTPEHPQFAELQAYGYLSYLVDACVDALSADL